MVKMRTAVHTFSGCRFNYISNLRGMTKGRAQYTMQLERYEPVPTHIQEKIVAGVNVAARS